MLKNEREREIVNLLKKNDGFISVAELCRLLYASESSIRRDLRSLEGRGIVRRSYGGAEIIKNPSSSVAFGFRTNHNSAAKRDIARKAATLIKNGDVIFLDQSSSAFYLAKEIMHNDTLTVVTNNIEILSLLCASKIRTIASGGTLCRDNRSCLVGSDAERCFSEIYADVVFFSAKALSDDGVITDLAREEVSVRGAMLKNAAKKVFLCDSEKFGERSAYKQCTLSDIDVIISEEESAKRYEDKDGILVM